jgi:hypothetical protein
MTLVRTVTPMPDESLTGLIARAAGINIYPHAYDVTAQAGLGVRRPESIASRPVQTAERLAQVLGASSEAVRRLYHPEVDAARVDFFGVPLRAQLREIRKRRVSPLALRDRPYIRALWSVRPLSFDPDTREMLICECPVCNRTLGFTRTWGVERCEHCIGEDDDGLPVPTVDLRDFPQPLIEVEDEEGLDHVVALLDPRRNANDLPTPHEELSALDRGELFELALALAGGIEADAAGMSFDPEGTKTVPTADVSPEALAKAGRVLMSWPAGFDDICTSAMAKAEGREGKWGIHKELGAFAVLRTHVHIPVPARRLLAGKIEALMANAGPAALVPRKSTRRRTNGEYVGVRELIRTSGVGSKIMSRLANHPGVFAHRPSADPMAPITLANIEASHVLGHYKDLVSEVSLGVTLGLPPDAIRDLTYLGDMVTPWRQIAIDLVEPGRYFSKQTSEEFIDIVSTGLPFRPTPPTGYIPFLEAMLMFPSGRRPWQPVIEQVIFQEVSACFRQNVADKPKIKNLFGFVSLSGIEQKRDIILEWSKTAPEHDIGPVSAVAANLMLGIYNHHVFMACAEEELLLPADDGTVDYQDVLGFAQRYIFANEAAVRSRNSGTQIRGWLEARNVRPLRVFDVRGGVIYDRQQVEPHLELKAYR